MALGMRRTKLGADTVYADHVDYAVFLRPPYYVLSSLPLSN